MADDDLVLPLDEFLNAPKDGASTNGTSDMVTSGTPGIVPGAGPSAEQPQDFLLDNTDPDALVPFDPVRDIRLTPDQFTKSPLELLTKEEIAKSRLGLQGPDKKFILDRQNVSNSLRWQTQLFFDRADEKAAFLRKELPDYEFAIDPAKKTDIILRRKGTKYWGKLDPSMDTDSYGQEIAENLDGIAQAFAIPTSALGGALAAGGIEGMRQFIKTQLSDDAKFSVGSVAVNAAAGGIAGGISGAIKGTKRAATEAIEDASALKATAAVKSAGKLLQRVEYKLQNMGATKADFARGAEEKLGWLLENAPEAADAINNPFTLKGKLAATEKVLEETGQKIGAFYGDPNNVVDVAEILGSKEAQLLGQIVDTGRVQKGLKTVITDEATINRARLIQRDLLTRIGRAALGEEDKFFKAFKTKNLLDIPEVAQHGFKTENEAMAAILSGTDITAAEARAIRDGIASKLKFGKEKGQIRELDTAYKHAMDSLIEGIEGAVKRTGDNELLFNNKVFNNLVPIAEILDNAVNASKATGISFTRWIPAAIGGIRYQVPRLASKVVNRPEFRAALGRISGKAFPLPEGAAAPSPGKLLRGASFLELKALGKKQFLPRDSEAYFNDPEVYNALAMEVDDPELMDALGRQLERGDKDAFANTLSRVAADNEKLFDAAPYNSLIMKEGKPVLQDKYDREAYRQWVEKNVFDVSEQYEILTALNFDGTMLKEPFAPRQLKITGTLPDGSKPAPANASPTSRVASKLKAIGSVELNDGTERVKYDY